VLNPVFARLCGDPESELQIRGQEAVMKKPEWHDVLGPREAVIAGIAGLAALWALTYYAYHSDYIFWGYSPPQWKNLGTVMAVLGFAVPYCLVKWLMRRR
jgi:hypothetical protein